MRFSRPPIGTVRKRFAWWPKHATVISGKYVPEKNATMVPFFWGFHNPGPAAFPYSAPRKNKKPPTSGTVLAPVMYVQNSWLDGWIWLEWYVEELEASYRGVGGETSITVWRMKPPTKQWNAFHEYD